MATTNIIISISWKYDRRGDGGVYIDIISVFNFSIFQFFDFSFLHFFPLCLTSARNFRENVETFYNKETKKGRGRGKLCP